MRLIDTHTLRLTDSAHLAQLPPYVILSHRWDAHEISFEDMLDPEHIAEHPGYAKLFGFCTIARNYGYKYVWIDTCCINKASSAELSEAINSMYLWYKKSAVCFVYLRDVSDTERPSSDPKSAFARAEWFTRGWTLQELLAPHDLVFFAQNWTAIGTKLSEASIIAKITRISIEALQSPESVLKRFSIAQKMSWAATRRTTRVEDRAYSLMGIFGVNMSTIYGEAMHAFHRLQEEIIKQSTDQTIFAWRKLTSIHECVIVSYGDYNLTDASFQCRPAFEAK